MLEHPDIERTLRYGYPQPPLYVQENTLDDIRFQADYWAENELDEGREATWARFVDAHPQYDREELIEVIDRGITAAVKRNDPYSQLELKHEHERAMEHASTTISQYTKSIA